MLSCKVRVLENLIRILSAADTMYTFNYLMHRNLQNDQGRRHVSRELGEELRRGERTRYFDMQLSTHATYCSYCTP